jgi:hypothetical protein
MGPTEEVTHQLSRAHRRPANSKQRALIRKRARVRHEPRACLPACANCPASRFTYVSSRVCANCCQNLPLGITRPSTLAPSFGRLSTSKHVRHVGTANLTLGAPSGPLTTTPVHLRTSDHQLAFTRTIPRPTARQNRSLMAVLAVPPRPPQCRPSRSAAAVW